MRAKKTANMKYEKVIYGQGFKAIVGMDEAGRGAWAGPVAVGAVSLPIETPGLAKMLTDVRDSKEMTPRQRTRVVETIKERALAWGVGIASHAEIDEIGIEKAQRVAMQRALDDACQRYPNFKPDCLLLDALLWPEMIGKLPQVSIVDGDARSLSIAAASIVAKTWRDTLMSELDSQYPQYGFAEHKGYGTAKHQAALKAYGICTIHRRYYKPILRVEQGEA
jgi:ribonuclease HII